MRLYFRKITAVIVLLGLMCSLAACSSSASSSESDSNQTDSVKKYPGTVNEPISSTSKWINSSIYGAIDSSLQANLKDDYQTAVNKDWILEQTPDGDHPSVSIFSECDDIIKERKISLITETSAPLAEFEPLDSETLQHNLSLVRSFAQKAADWDTRNHLASEPLRKYIQAIEKISSLEDLTVYLSDISGTNFTGECFLNLEIMSGFVDQNFYRLTISPSNSLILPSEDSYKDIGADDLALKDVYAGQVIAVLADLGYSTEDSQSLLRLCFELEGKLVDHNDSILSDEHSINLAQQSRTLEELENLCGSFPIRRVLQSRGMDKAKEYHFYGDGYLAYLGSVYTEEYLPLIRAYLIAHTAKAAAPLLTRAEYEIYHDLMEKTKAENTGTGTEGPKYEDEWDDILNDYITTYLAGPMDIVYISQYCSPEAKSQVIDLIYSVKNTFRTIILEEDWLTDAAKEASCRKLDMMSVRAVYPDYFEDYSDIVFDPDDTLIDMVHKINCHTISEHAEWIDRENDRSRWDLDEIPTTVVNAYYSCTENAFCILAGILTSPALYNSDGTYEQQLAGLGCIIGHEITHGFDKNGSQFNEYGAMEDFWSIDDKNSFYLRTSRLENYYSSLSIYPGSDLVNGSRVSGEATADMGGMKIALEIAEGQDSFDYDLFFRSFAQVWRTVSTYEYDKNNSGDPHPPAFLRVNVTLMQYDKYYETYGIVPGDGMYMAPEDRIAVW